MSDATIYVNADRTLLLTGQIDGQDIKLEIYGERHEIAVRDMVTRRWGPPVLLQPEQVTP